MSDLIFQQNNLPENINDLSKFALIGRDKLTAVRAEINAIKKLGLAKEVHEQKLQEAQGIAELVTKAETKIGEMLLEIPKASNDRGNQYTGGKSTVVSNSQKPKAEVIKDLGFTQKQAERLQTMAKNPEVVERAIAEAKENDDIVSRSFILEKIKNKEKEQRHEEIKKKFKNVPKDTYNGKLIEGDLFQKIDEISNNSIDMLFADPPYMILNQEWDSYKNISDFMDFTKKWLDIVVAKIKQTGRIYISFSQYYQFDLYNLLRDNSFFGFNFGQVIIWNYRNNNKPSDKKMYRFAYEPIFYLYGKQADVLHFPPETYGEIQSNVWTIAIPQSNFNEGKYHPAQKPIELLERIILTGSKEADLILDPFAGSGTTGVVAKKLKRDFVLIEKDSQYCQIARGRMNGVD